LVNFQLVALISRGLSFDHYQNVGARM